MPAWNQLFAGLMLAALTLFGLTIAPAVALLVLGTGVALYLAAASVTATTRRLRGASREIDKILSERIARGPDWSMAHGSAEALLARVPEHWRPYCRQMGALARSGAGDLTDKMRPYLADYAVYRPTRAHTDCPRGHWGLHHITGNQLLGSQVLVLRRCAECGLEWAETTEGS